MSPGDGRAALDEGAKRLQRQSRDQEAIEVFRKIVDLDATNPLPHLRLAEALSRAKDIDGAVLDAKGVEDQLATMPGKNELRATLLATLQAPPQSFVALLQAPAQNLVYLFAAKESEGGEK